MTTIHVIVEQHAEESSFLWLLRCNAAYAPNYKLNDLSKLDDRVKAHIDGLRIAGNDGWEICKEALNWEDTGEVFTAAVLAFESGNKERIQAVLEVGNKDPELSRGVVSALGWIPFDQIESHVSTIIEDPSPNLRRIGLAAHVVHRQYPGPYLTHALSDSDDSLRARILRAVGELGRKECLPAVMDHLDEELSKCRFFAAWSAAILGNTSAVSVLRSMTENQDYRSGEASAMALRKMKLLDANTWLRKLDQHPEYQRLVATGYGVNGDPMSVPELIRMMEIPKLARAAGEAFAMITGVDIAYEDLEGDWPEGFEAGPTENPEDEDVEMDPDENLPWPEPKLIQKWWHKNKSNFRSGVRYLCGKPISEEQCQYVLRHGYQRQRAAAAIELAMMKPGTPLFNVKAPGFRQQKLLGLK